MICYRCGCTLSEKDFCTGCGADVGMYKKILALSNRYYNDALEKCYVRDLSGAIVLLKQSLKLNKNNVDARNLLGLVYYEIGEVVEALGQWVISSNIRDTKNIATDYVEMIQENQVRLENMNQNLRKFNQSLNLCYSDSVDYAIIQLKKILSVAPKYLKAHQLLALCYIKNEEWEKAKRELEKSEAIDVNNTLTLHLKQEVENVLTPVEVGHSFGKKKKNEKEGVQVYQSGNETIIQPVNKKESRTTSILLNIGIGIIIGVAMTYFLVLPGKIYAVNEAANEKIQVISDEKDKKAADLDAMGLQLSKLEDENAELRSNVDSFSESEGTIRSADALMQATQFYLEDPSNIESVATALEGTETPEGEEEETKSECYISLYNKLMSLASSDLASFYYNRGYNSYKSEDYETAIPDLKRAYKYDRENGEALFYTGNAYRRIGEDEKAKEIYAEVIDFFPGTERANKAETYLAEINNQE